MSKKYRSDAMASVHETMEALRSINAIDKQTMRRFDDACLMPIRLLTPEEIPERTGEPGQASGSGKKGVSPVACVTPGS